MPQKPKAVAAAVSAPACQAALLPALETADAVAAGTLQTEFKTHPVGTAPEEDTFQGHVRGTQTVELFVGSVPEEPAKTNAAEIAENELDGQQPETAGMEIEGLQDEGLQRVCQKASGKFGVGASAKVDEQLLTALINPLADADVGAPDGGEKKGD